MPSRFRTTPQEVYAIRRRLFAWYKKHQRDLPWRKTRNPYHILVSEIMLQQTQVDRVLSKYREFLKTFPTVQALAQAKTADVIRAWKGLGYNRRALYLQKTAQVVVQNYHGRFPKDLDQLKTLPGVGDYTARALLSFAFELPVPMMDTNHRRFYQRIFFGLKEKSDKMLLETAESILPNERAYDWNQALMDFGSFVCLTQKPMCAVCPVQQWCKAYPTISTSQGRGVVMKRKKQTIPFKKTDRYVRGFILNELREQGSTTERKIVAASADFSPERIAVIVQKLQRDGLIRYDRGRILLPDT